MCVKDGRRGKQKKPGNGNHALHFGLWSFNGVFQANSSVWCRHKLCELNWAGTPWFPSLGCRDMRSSDQASHTRLLTWAQNTVKLRLGAVGNFGHPCTLSAEVTSSRPCRLLLSSFWTRGAWPQPCYPRSSIGPRCPGAWPPLSPGTALCLVPGIAQSRCLLG